MKKIYWIVLFVCFFSSLVITAGLAPAAITELSSQVDASKYPSLASAIAAAHGKAVVISNEQRISANLAIPSTVELIILKGGSILKTAPCKLTINGPFRAGLYQVFSGFGARDVTFGPGSITEISPQWWGARCDGENDDTLPLQSAIDAITEGMSVKSPHCRYKITDTLDFSSLGNGYAIKEVDFGGSDITWYGNDNKPMIKFYNNKNISLRNFRLFGRNTKGVVGIFLNSLQPDFIFNIDIDKFRIEDCSVGMLWGAATRGVHPNVSNNKISNFSIVKCDTGIKFDSVNTDLNIFETGTLAANTIDVDFHYTGDVEFKSVNGYGAKSDGGINTMFYISGAFDSIRLVDCQKEGIQKPLYFLRRISYAGTGSEAPLSIIDCFADADILFDGNGSAGGQFANFVGGYTRNITVNVSDFRLNFIGTYGKKGSHIAVNSPSGVIITNFNSKIDSSLTISHPESNEYLSYDNFSKFKGAQTNPGFMRFPDGLLWEWGTAQKVVIAPGKSEDLIVKFDPAFKDAPFTLMQTPLSQALSGVKSWVRSFHGSEATVRVQNETSTPQAIGLMWWAIGK